MNTFEIVKKAFYFPIHNYRGFIKVTFLFLLSEIISHIVFYSEIGDLESYYFLGAGLFFLLVLGASTIIVFSIIDSSEDMERISLRKSTKVGIKDSLIEVYYFILVIVVSTIVSMLLGFFNNFNSFFDELTFVGVEINNMTIPKLISYLSPDTLSSLSNSVLGIIIVFIVCYAIFFSLGSIAKIRLKETNDFQESLDFIKLFKIVMEKGIKKYLNFIIINFLVFGFVVVILHTLEAFPIIGSIVSALLESFSIFFILYSYTLFYYS